MKTIKLHTLIVGSGAAGLAAATRLHAEGIGDIAVVTEGLQCGTSINTGSDKQTYYKLGLYAQDADAPELLAKTFFDGGSMHGDLALVEAALSARCLNNLVNLGVPFPRDAYGQFIGYKTDHDPLRRATSCGPYTSKEMCLKLIEDLKMRNIKVFEKRVVVALPTIDENGKKRVVGAIAVSRKTNEYEFYQAENVVFAVGGPGGIYANSVYPAVHTGAIGIALAAGAKARNLPESQFGLASTKFRWNVSGTYMQVIPRFISTAADGVSDEREFLPTLFAGDIGDMNSMIFLKGYQWPFDVKKAKTGSSRVDLMVYQECVEKGRRVFLDFRQNSDNFSFDTLSGEAYDYLKRSNALYATPFERLKTMNPGAIELYKEHGIDIELDPLEIAVCAQHNNGGLAGNIWYESENISRLFPVGEVNGSHGVCRPGGSALNAGQVGGFRAAEYIAAKCNDYSLDDNMVADAANLEIARLESLLKGSRSWQSDRREFRQRMSRYGAQFRSREQLEVAVEEARRQLQDMEQEGYPVADRIEGLRNWQLCFAHKVYLEAILFAIRSGVGSRGSGLVLGSASDSFKDMQPEAEVYREQVLESVWCNDHLEHKWCERKPLPVCDGWFEEVWKDFREGGIYG